tara:strand:- start:573 stop:1382 length:810 start_codon:yes stop_codon:yes gene_type:complete
MTTLCVCELCNYKTNRKSSFNKHINSLKHKNRENSIGLFVCETCNKQYKYKSGLDNHQKNGKCLMAANLEEQSKQIQTLCALLEKSVAQNTETINKLSTTTNITNNIEKMTINVFLNEHCKDAMNFGMFVDNIKYTLEDLYYTRDNGYERGISNVFVKNLTEIPACERPIYCSDKKRLQFYVKDEDVWSKDADNEKINRGIDDITRKQICAIKTWEDAHPGWNDNSELTDEYLRIVKTITSMDNVSQDQIHKHIGSESDWQAKANDLIM